MIGRRYRVELGSANKLNRLGWLRYTMELRYLQISGCYSGLVGVWRVRRYRERETVIAVFVRVFY